RVSNGNISCFNVYINVCYLTSALNMSYPELEDACLTDQEYLERYRGARRSPMFLPVCLTYLAIFLVGAVGNVLTCTVIARNKVMWTPTNLYLFSLAVSDLLVLLLGMPLELYEMWQNYPFLLGAGGCYFKTFLFEVVCFASILNVTALSVERYIAVVHPLRAKYVVTRRHAKRVILTVWAASILCALPNTSLHGIATLPTGVNWYNLTIQVTTLVFFVLPMATISVLYLLIGLHLQREKMLQVFEAKSSSSGQESFCNVRRKQQKARHRQVTKMLFVLVVVFGICWAPFHTDRLMWSFISDWSEDQLETFQYVHLISGVLFYLSSAVNPILYNLMSTRFREMFREVMCRWPCQQPPRTHSFSATRATLRSTLSDAAIAAAAAARPPVTRGRLAVVEGNADADERGEKGKEDETSFAC
uniref:Neuromedin U receptor 1a n=1 Tax=Gadus morhua TaxID=8049 RepID=A0A8C4ZWP1_GADMO